MNDRTDVKIENGMSILTGTAVKESAPDLYWMSPRDKILMRDLRYVMRESQTQFWSRFGVGQSSGSRFERGMAVPLPVLLLIRLYFLHIVGDQDLQKVRSQEYENGEPIVDREKITTASNLP